MTDFPPCRGCGNDQGAFIHYEDCPFFNPRYHITDKAEGIKLVKRVGANTR